MSLYTITLDTSNISNLAIYTLKIEVIIYNKIRIYIILDNRAKVNVISKKLINKYNLVIKTKKNLIF
jgi:hypothetical protein